MAGTWQSLRAQDAPGFSQPELDQMLAPVALYPDALLSQVLMAATYPLEVVEADRWAQANPGLQGAAAVQAAQGIDWDPSVQSLLAFPRVLQTLSARLEWTQRLGDAFLGQQQQVMDTLQVLRHKALAAGSLVSNAQYQVLVEGDSIRIVPASAQVVYVPYYDPGVVYGPWWWPQYPPVYWQPWPGYAVVNGYGRGFWWGAGVVLGVDLFYGGFDWRRHHVNIDYDRFHDRHLEHRRNGVGPWEHNPFHRQGQPYRQPGLEHQFAGPQLQPKPQLPPFTAPPQLPTVIPPLHPPPALQAVPVPPKPPAPENTGPGHAERDPGAHGPVGTPHNQPPGVVPRPAPCLPGDCKPEGHPERGDRGDRGEGRRNEPR